MQRRTWSVYQRQAGRGRSSMAATKSKHALIAGLMTAASITFTTPAQAQDPDAPLTQEQCSCLGGQVRGDIGDGQVRCQDGERELGRVRVGIEGGVCCVSATSAALSPAAAWRASGLGTVAARRSNGA